MRKRKRMKAIRRRRSSRRGRGEEEKEKRRRRRGERMGNRRRRRRRGRGEGEQDEVNGERMMTKMEESEEDETHLSMFLQLSFIQDVIPVPRCYLPLDVGVLLP